MLAYPRMLCYNYMEQININKYRKGFFGLPQNFLTLVSLNNKGVGTDCSNAGLFPRLFLFA